MNKKMFFAAIFAIAVSSGIAGICIQKQESNLSALTRANVEALSKGESGDSGSSGTLQLPCCPSPTYTGSWNSMVLDCAGCTYRPQYSGSTSSKCI